MRIVLFDVHRYDREAFERARPQFAHDLSYLEARLTSATAPLAAGFDAACSFVDDRVDTEALEKLKAAGVRLLLLRSAGYNHVDLAAAARLGLPVVRVPEYSPHAVAEHTMALVMTLNRHIHRAAFRVRELNFSLEGLVGVELYRKTVGVIGTGRIGSTFAEIALGYGCRVLAFDLQANEALVTRGVRYEPLETVLEQADLVSLHVPLTPKTFHLLDRDAFARMKRGVMVVNTGRGALIDTKALIDALKTGHVGSAALDVYEEEEGVFFRDLSDRVLQDDVLARLLTFPNVLVTSHQAFLTREALDAIAHVTLENASAFERGAPLANEVRAV